MVYCECVMNRTSEFMLCGEFSEGKKYGHDEQKSVKKNHGLRLFWD